MGNNGRGQKASFTWRRFRVKERQGKYNYLLIHQSVKQPVFEHFGTFEEAQGKRTFYRKKGVDARLFLNLNNDDVYTTNFGHE